MPRRAAGFTFIEILIVVAVVGVLVAMSLPAIKESAMRRQVKEGLGLAEVAKQGVQATYRATGILPADNALAGVPPSDKIIGNMVTDVKVEQGAVTLTFGNNAGKSIEGKKVTLRPALVPGYPQVPIAWVCHDVAVPAKMELRGENRTDIPKTWLPVECRGAEKR